MGLDVAGAVIVVVTVVDMFLTIFNYDGFTTLTTLVHRGYWRVLRLVTRPLPPRYGHVALSLGSASMLPASVALWLALEITGFALLFDSSLGGGAFALKQASPTLDTAYYLSAGAISSLSFGDVIARGGFDRMLVDLETIIGLATFTLALGYVVAAFDALGKLENLHGRVRRYATDLERPESIVCRHFRGGHEGDLPSFLQALAEDLESYDQGLRRYPVVYYFHTRRSKRSVPAVFGAVGDLIALLRWGLPPDEDITHHPFLAALHDVYAGTLDRLRRSFVGPDPISVPEPVSPHRFAEAYAASGTDAAVDAFRALQRRGREAADADAATDVDAAYEQYREWLPFGYRERAVLDRVADRLGYDEPRLIAAAPTA